MLLGSAPSHDAAQRVPVVWRTDKRQKSCARPNLACWFWCNTEQSRPEDLGTHARARSWSDKDWHNRTRSGGRDRGKRSLSERI